MATAKVMLQGISTITVTVDIPDGLDPDEARDAAIDAAYQALPSLCHQCSGYGRKYSREDPGEWSLAGELNPGHDGPTDPDAVVIE